MRLYVLLIELSGTSWSVKVQVLFFLFAIYSWLLCFTLWILQFLLTLEEAIVRSTLEELEPCTLLFDSNNIESPRTPSMQRLVSSWCDSVVNTKRETVINLCKRGYEEKNTMFSLDMLDLGRIVPAYWWKFLLFVGHLEIALTSCGATVLFWWPPTYGKHILWLLGAFR